MIAEVESSGYIENIQSAVSEIIGSTITIAGTNNKLDLSAAADSEQAIDIAANLAGYLNHTSKLEDAVTFDIANVGSSMMSSAMASTAKSGSSMELDVSGIGTAAMQAGINNTVMTNVNNSIRNVFSMAVSNYMSSETHRESLAEVINAAYAFAQTMSKQEAAARIVNSVINISGDSNVISLSSKTQTTAGAVVNQEMESRVTAGTEAITVNTVTATSDISGTMQTMSSATAEATQTQESKLKTITQEQFMWIVIACGACAVLLAVFKMAGQRIYCKKVNKKRKKAKKLSDDTSDDKNDKT